MKVWRLARAAYTTPNGEGAKKYGGRWTPAGLAVVYTSASLALAAVESLVHADSDLLPDDLVILSANIPEMLPIRIIAPDDLPANWQHMPAPRTLLTIGGDWVRTNREVGLRVPSAVIPQEWNMLLNPAHRDFPAIEWAHEGPFHWDARLERKTMGLHAHPSILGPGFREPNPLTWFRPFRASIPFEGKGRSLDRRTSEAPRGGHAVPKIEAPSHRPCPVCSGRR